MDHYQRIKNKGKGFERIIKTRAWYNTVASTGVEKLLKASTIKPLMGHSKTSERLLESHVFPLCCIYIIWTTWYIVNFESGASRRCRLSWYVKRMVTSLLDGRKENNQEKGKRRDPPVRFCVMELYFRKGIYSGSRILRDTRDSKE